MCNGTDILKLELSCSELFEVVNALIGRAEKLLSMDAPEALVLTTISRAEKLNEVLKDATYDHRTEDTFTRLRTITKEKTTK